MFLTDGILTSFLLSILDLDFVIASCHKKMVMSNLSQMRIFFIPQTIETYLELLNLAIIGCSFST